MIKKAVVSLALAAALLFCAAALADTQVVCTFYPLSIFAGNVLSDVEGVSVVTLAPAGTGCLHDFQLLPGDMKKLSGAACLVINGAGMEDSFLPLIRKERADLPLVDCSQGIGLIGEGEEVNAHIWLDARNAAQMVMNLGEGLAALLPDSEAQIMDNARAYADRLNALHEEMSAAARGFANRDIATFHEAFPYLAGELGLRVAASVTVDPDEAPSPREIARIVETVSALPVCPLFAEPGVESDAMNVVVRETGHPVYTLSPVTDGDGHLTDYEDQMRENMQTLLTALGSL